MKRRIVNITLFALFSALSVPSAWGAEASAEFETMRRIASPDGALVFVLEGNKSTNALAWSVTRDGRPVIGRGALGLEIKESGVVGDKGPASEVGKRDVATCWRPPYGERSVIEDKFHEETLTLGRDGGLSPSVHLQVRAYNEGVAFRYVVSGKGTLTVVSEKTGFPLLASAAVWTSGSAQGKVTRQPVTAIKGGAERPLTAELAPDLFAALGEAGLVDGARMKFSPGGGSTLIARLEGSAEYNDGFTSAWRYVRVAKSPAALLEGNGFMQNLNEPNRIGDTSWLRPGKVLREVTLTTQGAFACIDFAASHGLQHIMFDAGWYGPEGNDKSDATTVTLDPKRSPGPLDLPKVIDYAKSRKIGVILYVNRRALER